MYIAQRRGQVRGMAGMAWAQEITKAVQGAGVPASLWAAGPGSVPGSVGWSTLVESLAELNDHMGTLMTNADYVRLVDAGSEHVEAMQADRLLQIVHGEIQGRAEVGHVVAMISAITNPERAAEALGWAASVADTWMSVTGLKGAVATTAAGVMGEVSWIVRYESYAAADAANAKIAASSDYAEQLAKGAGLFTNGQSGYAQRIA